jgi:RimJ/RimL family protein N-acetyltransferase
MQVGRSRPTVGDPFHARQERSDDGQRPSVSANRSCSSAEKGHDGPVLGESYDVGEVGRLQRLAPEFSEGFGAAFAAAEADLRQWMPSTAREQEDPVTFLQRCATAFENAATFAYAIVATTGEVIGYLNLTPAEGHAVIGYWLHPAWRGRGIVPTAVRVLSDAAFDVLPEVDRIHAHLDAANTASERVLAKAGFEHHETFTRPPRTASESDTEWLFVRHR